MTLFDTHRNYLGQRMSTTRALIIDQMNKIAVENNGRLADLSDDLVLLESGLDSLGFAILVTRLEDTLGVDPFSDSDDLNFPVTFGDFIKVYETAVANAA